MARPRIGKAKAEVGGGAYFASPKTHLDFIPTGCKLFDCALGGGYVLGRIANLVGDKSTGKTLLAIEACANFVAAYPDGKIWYNEVEAAFDTQYAEELGLPTAKVDFVEGCYTVEDVFEHLDSLLSGKDKDQPGLYILDSLDALSDRSELERKIDEGSYGANKAKQLSQMFRRLTQKIEKSRVAVLIISQVRDAIGVTFGRKTTRSGGRALDFYASQVVYLAQMGTIKRTINKVERPIGLNIKAKIDKNKVGLPLREVQFPIRFGYGIDDLNASIDWLDTVGLLELIDQSKSKLPFFRKKMEQMSDDEYRKATRRIAGIVEGEWYKLEREFVPTRRKY